MKHLTKLPFVLLVFVLAACSFDPGNIWFAIGLDLPAIEISLPTSPPASPSASLTPTPTPTATIPVSPTPAPTIEWTPTQESVNRIVLTARAHVRSTPAGASLRVADEGDSFTVFAQRDGWLDVGEGWIFFGGWVEFTSGNIDRVPVSQVAEDTGTRISYNINGVDVPDWDYLWAHLEAIQPTSLLIMDNIFRACEAAQRLPNTIVIHRDYSALEGDEWLLRPNPQDWLVRWRGEGCYEVIRYATNEPSLHNLEGFIASEIALMDAADSEGIRLCVGNFGVGTLPHWAVEGGLFDDWLRAVRS